MIEQSIDVLFNYGGLGALAALLIYDKVRTQNRLMQVIDNNTRIIGSVESLILNCDFTKKNK